MTKSLIHRLHEEGPGIIPVQRDTLNGLKYLQHTIAEVLARELPGKGLTSIHGDFRIRFDLGGDLENGTIARVDQATERALEVFKRVIDLSDVLLLTEETRDRDFDQSGAELGYYWSIIGHRHIEQISGPFYRACFMVDEHGTKSEFEDDVLDCDLLFTRSALTTDQVEQLLRGTANLEMGLEPSISQAITFFSPKTLAGFRMYDDRGCDIWASNKETLLPIHEDLKTWVIEHDLPI